MSLGLQIFLPPAVMAAALLIGCASELRYIVRRRAELATECGATGFDPRLAFEIADVDRHGIERRVMRSALEGAMAMAVAMLPARYVARYMATQLDWSMDARLVFGSVLSLAGPVLWSGIKAQRSATEA
jgi:hypothetical protein